MRFKPYIIYRQPNFSLTEKLNLDKIDDLLKNERILESIYVASPGFYDIILKFQKGEISKEKDLNSFFSTLRNYMLRMSTNPIPFGLFSSLGIYNPNNDSPPHESWKVFDIDGIIYLQLVDKLHGYDKILPTLLLGLNSSVKTEGNRILYTEKKLKGAHFEIEHCSISMNEFLDELFPLLSKNKGTTIQEAIEIGLKLEFDEDEIRGYLAQLLQSNVLTSQLTINSIVEEKRFAKLLEVTEPLQESEAPNSIISIVYQICCLLQDVNSKSGSCLHQLIEITNLLESLDINLELVKSPFTVLSFDNSNPPAIRDEIKQNAGEILDLLVSLFDSTRIETSQIAEFEKKFREKYFDDAIPLEEALDPVKGIGFPINSSKRVTNAIVKGIPLKKETEKAAKKHSLTQFEDTLVKELIRNELSEEIKIDTLKSLNDFIKDESTKFEADNFSIMLNVEESKGVNHYTFNHACFTSDTRLIGRFSVGSIQTKEIIEDLHSDRIQKTPDRLVADFSYFQNPVHINIASTHSGFDYEIVHLNRGSKEKTTIRPQDLFLQIINNSLGLFDIKSGKIVEINIGTAVRTSRALDPVVRFLSDYQFYKRIPAVKFILPSSTDTLPYIPRISYKSIVLSPARWLLNYNEIQSLSKIKNTAFKDAVSAYAKSINIPNNVYFIEGENRYRFNLHTSFGLDYIVKLIKENKTVLLEESFVDLSENYRQVLLFGNREIDRKISPPVKRKKVTFSTFDDSVFSVSLYIKEKGNEQIIKTLKSELFDNQPESKFFIVKYRDSGFHLRVRFIDWKSNLDISSLITSIQKLIESGVISSYKIEPFRPELSRYGGKELVRYAYALFCNETFEIIENIEKKGENTLPQLYTKIMSYLNEFGKHHDVFKLIESAKNGFQQEFGLETKQGKKFLETKYKEHLPIIKSIDEKEHENPTTEPILKEYLSKLDNNVTNPYQLVSALIHMYLNRAVSSSQRETEAVLYYSIWRYKKMQAFKNQKR